MRFGLIVWFVLLSGCGVVSEEPYTNLSEHSITAKSFDEVVRCLEAKFSSSPIPSNDSTRSFDVVNRKGMIATITASVNPSGGSTVQVLRRPGSPVINWRSCT